jgi:putative transposase
MTTAAETKKGSANWEKARRRVVKHHTYVPDPRRHFHHDLSTRLVRDHQTVGVETLNVAGLGRSNLAKSIHDAGRASSPRCSYTRRSYTDTRSSR